MNCVSHATCMICAKTYAKGQFDYICPDHGNEGILDIQYDYEAIGKVFAKADLAASTDPSIFRYRPLLPIEHDSPTPTMVVGNTPLLQFDILGNELGIERLLIKDDGHLPTASFKDRASTIAVVKAQELKAEVLTTAKYRQRCRCAQWNLCLGGPQECDFCAGQCPPGQTCPTADVWFHCHLG